MILQTVLIIALIALIVPVITLLLMGIRPKNPFRAISSKGGAYSFDSFLAALKRTQAEIKDINYDEEEKESYVMFVYQGGNFLAVYDQDPDTRLTNTATIGFYNCFSTDFVNLEVIERTVNSVNGRSTPIRITMRPSDDGSTIDVSFHMSGLRIANNDQDVEFLKTLLAVFFDIRQILTAEFDKTMNNDPTAVVRNIAPRVHASYVMERAEVENFAPTWDGPWWETPKLTLRSVVDRLTGVIPTDEAKIIVNGQQIEQNASEFEPFKMMLKPDLRAEDPVICRYLTIDILEQQHLMHNNVHLILRLEDVEERLITIHMNAILPGLPVSAFRPIGSPETLPRAFSSVIGIHRGGPEMFKAEAEYMAQEQGLIETLRNGDAAYCFYWGSALFASNRFFEAAHYLKNAFDILAPAMRDPEKQSQELADKFLDICFFLGITYYKLGRYHDSYYYLDIIINQHRTRWTQQYILTLVALRDPRITTMITNLRENLVEQQNSDDNGPHIEELIRFIDRQLILAKIQQGKTDEARRDLEKRLEEAPDDDFALFWLANLG